MEIGEIETTLAEKVSHIQHALKAPKDKSTYAYSYRNAEEILGKVKPLLVQYGLVITLDDDIIAKGEPCRWFIKSTATITDGETGSFQATACAEILTPSVGRDSGKASMNESQASGATSSYARKYALGGLLGIDDGDDADDAKYQPGVMSAEKPATQSRNAKTNPATQIRQEHFSGAIKDTEIHPEVFKQLCFLPGNGRGNLGLDKDVAKKVWDECWQKGWRRGKFDMNSKTWSGTQIPTSAVPEIVGMFCNEAGLSETATKAKVSQILAAGPYIPEAETVAAEQLSDENDLQDYSDAPF